MLPKFISFEKREHLLKYLDETIMASRKKANIFILAGIGCLVAHNLIFQ